MSLSEDEQATVSEMAQISFAAAVSLTANLNGALTQRLQDECATWEVLRTEDIKIHGASNGIDLDPERQRTLIAERVCNLLNIDTPALRRRIRFSSPSMSVPVQSVF